VAESDARGRIVSGGVDDESSERRASRNQNLKFALSATVLENR
jgi:hypothetical protein